MPLSVVHAVQNTIGDRHVHVRTISFGDYETGGVALSIEPLVLLRRFQGGNLLVMRPTQVCSPANTFDAEDLGFADPSETLIVQVQSKGGYVFEYDPAGKVLVYGVAAQSGGEEPFSPLVEVGDEEDLSALENVLVIAYGRQPHPISNAG